MFSELLTSLGLAPKTLPQARETIDSAKTFADSVAALFTSAGLNLEQLIAAGPDALKAHIEGLDFSEDLANALLEVERLEADLDAKTAEAATLTTQIGAATELFASIGITATSTPEAVKTAFADHVAKQVTLALAKTGHPPVVHIPAGTETPTTNADHLAVYRSMPAGPERLAYFAKHEAAILNAHKISPRQ